MNRPHARPLTVEASDLAPFVATIAAASSQLRRVSVLRVGLMLPADAETAGLIAGHLDELRELIRAAAWPAGTLDPKDPEPHEASR